METPFNFVKQELSTDKNTKNEINNENDKHAAALASDLSSDEISAESYRDFLNQFEISSEVEPYPELEKVIHRFLRNKSLDKLIVAVPDGYYYGRTQISWNSISEANVQNYLRISINGVLIDFDNIEIQKVDADLLVTNNEPNSLLTYSTKSNVTKMEYITSYKGLDDWSINLEIRFYRKEQHYKEWQVKIFNRLKSELKAQANEI